jgi:hypothetical protein
MRVVGGVGHGDSPLFYPCTMVHHGRTTARNSCMHMSMSDGEHRSKRPYEPASTNAEPYESREGDNSQPLHKRVIVACEQGSEDSRDTTPKLAPAAKVIIIIVLFICIVALLPIFE